MAAATIMNNLLFGHPGPPTFGDIEILQIWLKTLIPAPKIYVLGVLTLKHYFSGTFLVETAHFEPLSVTIGPAVHM